MAGRFACAVGFLLACGAVCGAQQTAAPVVAVQQASAMPEVVNSPEMDALAGKIIETINAYKVSSVVVVGGADPENKVSVLGASLRDGLNESMVRQAAGLRVISSPDVTDLLKRNRVSAGMIYCNLVSEWIAAHAQMDVSVVLRLERVENGRAMVTAGIWDERKALPADKHAKVAVPYAKVGAEITLTERQISSGTVQYSAPSSVPISNVAMDRNIMPIWPICLYCPALDYHKLGSHPKFHGTIYTQVTVLPDGTATDIWIVRPVGSGLDPIAIDTLLKWKFKPGVDGQKHPVATVVPVELAFDLN